MTTAQWASRPLSTPAGEVTAAIRKHFPLKLIETPRSQLLVREKADWPRFQSDPELAAFDHVPVTSRGEIVGVFERSSMTIRDLSETMLMASDASLLDFIRYADERPFALLVDEGAITGMVTRADLQKLPVYSVVFSLLMAVEMLLVEWIRRECADEPDRWLQYLDPRAQKAIERHWEQALEKNVAIDRLSCASFTDELTAAIGLGIERRAGVTRQALETLRSLRNAVCHGMEIAMTPDRALQLPLEVREAIALQNQLAAAMQGEGS